VKEKKITRRSLMGAAAGVAAFTIVPRHVLGGTGQPAPSDKINIAGIGVGGRGAGDLQDLESQNIVALCDVDWRNAAETFRRYPNARKYKDFREMLDKEDKNIDAVMVATADHCHAPASMAAIKRGKHVYCEKPLTHTVLEAKMLADAARERKVATQMGNQGQAEEGVRLLCETIWAGAIGQVHEVHIWTDRPLNETNKWYWPQGVDRPVDMPAVPDTLDWDLWLGPAPKRPYNPAYLPFKWRGWWDFGCGAIGDMAVHNADPAFFALDLGAPTAVQAETSPVNDETLPVWNIITFEFPAKGDRPAVKMVWYDGAKLPPTPPELEGRKLGDNGILFVGDKGKLLGPSHAGAPRLIPESRQKEYGRPPKTLPRSPGHHMEWIEACKAGRPEDARSGFWYAGPFVEALLVGNLAVRLQRRVEWDSVNMRSPNCPEADNYITKFYRNGYRLV
jgi:predicted dehydrogenase